MDLNLIIQRLLAPETLRLVGLILTALLYLKGRITEGQFIAEQLKASGEIKPEDAKTTAINSALNPVTVVFDALNYVPVLNSKLPLVNASIPDIAKGVVQGTLGVPIGLLSDILHNLPLIGTNVKKS